MQAKSSPTYLKFGLRRFGQDTGHPFNRCRQFSHAADFILENPKGFQENRLTVLVIGAATHAASAILKDPTILNRIRIVSTAPSKSEAYEAQDLGTEAGAMAERGGRCNGHRPMRSSEMAREAMTCAPIPLGTWERSFVKGDIADPMEAVFDRPMAPAQAEQASGSCSLAREAGNAVDGFAPGFLANEFGAFKASRREARLMPARQVG